MAIKDFIDASTPTRTFQNIDNDYGYDDMLLVATGNPQLPVSTVTTFSTPFQQALLIGQDNPSSFKSSQPNGETKLVPLTEQDAVSVMRQGDQLFRLPNGGILLRRSVFSDACIGQSRPNNKLLLSENMARALALFGDTDQGGNAKGDLWCGASTSEIETPWNLEELRYVTTVEIVLEKVQHARKGTLPEGLPEHLRKDALAVASAVTDSEIAGLKNQISRKKSEAERKATSTGDSSLFSSFGKGLGTLGLGLAAGAGGAVTFLATSEVWQHSDIREHFVDYLAHRHLPGGPTLLSALAAYATTFIRRPPPPNGGNGGGNTSGPSSPSGPSDSSPSQRMSLDLEKLAVGASTILLGIATIACAPLRLSITPSMAGMSLYARPGNTSNSEI